MCTCPNEKEMLQNCFLLLWGDTKTSYSTQMLLLDFSKAKKSGYGSRVKPLNQNCWLWGVKALVELEDGT
jgi:hypothetical protein